MERQLQHGVAHVAEQIQVLLDLLGRKLLNRQERVVGPHRLARSRARSIGQRLDRRIIGLLSDSSARSSRSGRVAEEQLGSLRRSPAVRTKGLTRFS